VCGLVGFVSSEKTESSGFLHEGLLSNMWRGFEAIGLSLTTKGKEKESPIIYKDALCAFDFCGRPFVQKVFEQINDYSIVMGHCRSATKGNNVTRNAHPFQHKHITLEHNGTIENTYDLMPFQDRPKDMVVDSEVVAYCMANVKENEDEEKVLEMLKGPFAMVWHNTRDGSFNIARNDKKPLYFAYVKGRNTLYYTSEYTNLIHLLERRGMKIEKVLFPDAMGWFKFSVDNVREYVHRPFVARPPTYPITHLGPNYSTGGNNIRPLAEGEISKQELLREILGTDGRVVDLENTEAVKEFLRLKRIALPETKLAGLPRKPSRVQSASKELAKFGLRFHQAVILTPDSWEEHKNNKDLGLMLGSSTTFPKLTFAMLNVNRADYQKYKEFGKVFCNVVNIKKLDANNRTVMVVTEHVLHAERSETFFREKLREAQSKSSIYPHYYGPQEEGRIYLGPTGQYVTPARFLELTKNGCSYCTGDIHTKDHLELIWIRGDEPICPECQNKQEFWDYVGETNPEIKWPRDNASQVM